MNSNSNNTDDLGHTGLQVQKLQWTVELIQKFWDYQSNFPQSYFTTKFGAQITEIICKLIPQGARVLDYACGAGTLTGYMLDAGMLVAASDLSPNSLRLVKDRYLGREGFIGAFEIGEVLKSDMQFDVVVLIELVEHVNDDVLHGIFNDVWQVLVPGGIVIVSCPNDEDLEIETVYCPCCSHTFHRWQHVRSFSATTLNELFSSKGLTPVMCKAVDFSLSPVSGRLRYWIKCLLNLMGTSHLPHLVGVARKPMDKDG